MPFGKRAKNSSHWARWAASSTCSRVASGLPIKIFSSQERQFASPAEAIIYGRETGRKKAVDDFKAKYDFVIQILSERQPELLEKISDWKDLYEEEREKVITLNAPVQGG